MRAKIEDRIRQTEEALKRVQTEHREALSRARDAEIHLLRLSAQLETLRELLGDDAD